MREYWIWFRHTGCPTVSLQLLYVVADCIDDKLCTIFELTVGTRIDSHYDHPEMNQSTLRQLQWGNMVHSDRHLYHLFQGTVNTYLQPDWERYACRQFSRNNLNRN